MWTRSVRLVIDYISHLQKVTVASKRIGTQGNPSSPLNQGVSDPEQILKEARWILSSTSLEKFKHPSALEIPESSFSLVPSFDPHSEKGKEELDLLFTLSQIDNFQVFTNPFLSKDVKIEVLQIGASYLLSSHISFVKTVPVNHPNPSNLLPSSQYSSTNQSNSSSNISCPRMAQPQNRMATMVAARYTPLVFP